MLRVGEVVGNSNAQRNGWKAGAVETFLHDADDTRGTLVLRLLQAEAPREVGVGGGTNDGWQARVWNLVGERAECDDGGAFQPVCNLD